MLPFCRCFILLLSLVFLGHAQEEQPFWRQKKKVYTQLLEQRRIVVSVKDQVDSDKKHRFRMVGAGAVNVPVDFAVTAIQDFEKLKSVSSYFKIVRHVPEKRQIYIAVEAMGYEARMLLEYKLSFTAGKPKQQMDWQVIWGTFKGMVGHFQFLEINPRQTEVALWSHFKAAKIPIPAFLLRFTLEVIAEKVAQKMRSYLENEYRQKQKENQQNERRRESSGS